MPVTQMNGYNLLRKVAGPPFNIPSTASIRGLSSGLQTDWMDLSFQIVLLGSTIYGMAVPYQACRYYP
jgi:hypothetical protein